MLLKFVQWAPRCLSSDEHTGDSRLTSGEFPGEFNYETNNSKNNRKFEIFSKHVFSSQKRLFDYRNRRQKCRNTLFEH